MTTAAFLLGLALVVAGVGMIYVPAAFITAGAGAASLAALYHRGGGSQ